MSFVMEVGFGPGHIVLDGDPGPAPPTKGAEQPPPTTFLAHVSDYAVVVAFAP